MVGYFEAFQDCQMFTGLCWRLRGYAGEDGITNGFLIQNFFQRVMRDSASCQAA